MSADLLAEFDSFYKTPQQPASQGQPKQQQPAAVSNDPFDFSGITLNNTPAVSTQQTQQRAWPLVSQPQSSSGGIWGDIGSLSGAAATNLQSSIGKEDDDDDDGWGDFEVAEPVSKPAVVATSTTPLSKAPPAALGPQRTRILRASTIDLMTNNLVDIASSVPRPSPSPIWEQSPTAWAPQPQPPPKSQTKTQPRDPNILFDADDLEEGEGEGEDEDEDDDDFGEFETVAASSQPPTQPPSQPAPSSFHLLSSDDAVSPQKTRKKQLAQLSPLSFGATSLPHYPQAPRSPSFQERNPFPGLAITPKSAEFKPDTKAKSPSPVTAWPSYGKPETPAQQDPDDEWAAFEDFPPEKAEPMPAQPPSPSNWDWGAEDSTSRPVVESKDDEPPPVNIPPPSILLSVFPQLLDLANSTLYKPVAGKSASVREKVIADPRTITFLRGYLLLSTVAGRVIAGRKLRWNRDKFLSQGMAMSAAGGKGMKLAGIDKAETSREDREAADVIAVWKEHVGRLRSAVAAANAAIHNGSGPGPQLRIPEIGESMQVQTAKDVPTAPKPCIICGLKRVERVAKVDYEVEDSFGEWWVPHWGHRACKNFWLQHEMMLRQR
jgi:hypothetical protein